MQSFSISDELNPLSCHYLTFTSDSKGIKARSPNLGYHNHSIQLQGAGECPKSLPHCKLVRVWSWTAPRPSDMATGAHHHQVPQNERMTPWELQSWDGEKLWGGRKGTLSPRNHRPWPSKDTYFLLSPTSKEREAHCESDERLRHPAPVPLLDFQGNTLLNWAPQNGSECWWCLFIDEEGRARLW